MSTYACPFCKREHIKVEQNTLHCNACKKEWDKPTPEYLYTKVQFLLDEVNVLRARLNLLESGNRPVLQPIPGLQPINGNNTVAVVSEWQWSESSPSSTCYDAH